MDGLQDNGPSTQLHELPDCPTFALIVAGAFRRLGGFLAVDSAGRAMAGLPMNPEPGQRPQMPYARPSEQFHSDHEWRGAIKVAEYFLTRLSARDKALVFGLVDPVCDDGAPFDFRDRL